MKGSLSLGGTFAADVSLLLQLVMGVALVYGMMLARRRHYRAHCWCQSSVLLCNLVLIGGIMAPSFFQQVMPEIPHNLGDSYYAVATLHAALGTGAELLGVYIVLATGTSLIPARLRFSRYKPWMRTELALWWLVLLLGFGIYSVWYLPSAGAAEPAKAADRSTVTTKNFDFSPKKLTIVAGASVEWTDEDGRHKIVADDDAFTSPTLTASEKFEHRFDRPGEFPYHCGFHGGKGGKGMSGVVKVVERAR